MSGDLKEQNDRIMAAGRAIAAIQDWYWKRRPESRAHVEELFDKAMKANVIYGDYASAEGYWHDLDETLDITRDRINDWASDLDI